MHAKPIIEQDNFLLVENLLEFLQEFYVALCSEGRLNQSVMDKALGAHSRNYHHSLGQRLINMLSKNSPTKDNPLVDEDQELPLGDGGLEALTQILSLDLPLYLRSPLADSLQLLRALIWLTRMHLLLIVCIFASKGLGIGCRSIFLAIGEDVPRDITINSGKLQEH